MKTASSDFFYIAIIPGLWPTLLWIFSAIKIKTKESEILLQSLFSFDLHVKKVKTYLIFEIYFTLTLILRPQTFTPKSAQTLPQN